MLRSLVDPLWLPILGLAAIWSVLWRNGTLRLWIKITGTAALASLWLTATPFGALVLERPLDVESELAGNWRPTFVYVLSGGYDLGDVPAHDSSGVETVRRVNKAAEMWQRYPEAVLVMAGSQPGVDGLRPADQQGRLMTLQAERLGVPARNIRVETLSLNTNGHAKVARDSGWHQPDDPLMIVTSDFHLRRARHEFARFFNNLRMIGSDPVISDGSFADLSIRSFFPKTDALQDSTTYLREYVALLLSDLRN